MTIGDFYFEASNGLTRPIATGVTEQEGLAAMNKFLEDHNFRSYYTRSWQPEPGHTVYDVGSHTEFFHFVVQQESTEDQD